MNKLLATLNPWPKLQSNLINQKAIENFEKKLWDAANELYGTAAENQLICNLITTRKLGK